MAVKYFLHFWQNFCICNMIPGPQVFVPSEESNAAGARTSGTRSPSGSRSRKLSPRLQSNNLYSLSAPFRVYNSTN